MELKDRLVKLLSSAGVEGAAHGTWLRIVDVMSFDRAEALVYLFERFGASDIVFLNKNLHEKVEFARTHLESTSSSRRERFSRTARLAEEAVARATATEAQRSGTGKPPQPPGDMANFHTTGVASDSEYHGIHLRPRSLVVRKLADIAGGGTFEMGSKTGEAAFWEKILGEEKNYLLER